MENKQSHKKIPIGVWILIGIFGLGFLSLTLFGKPKEAIRKATKEKQVADTETQIQDFHSKGEGLNNEVGDVFIHTTDTIFLKSHLENVSNSYINLELTISDVWYDLPKFKQERLIEDTCKIFDNLTVKYGLRKEDEMPWKVIFLDTYEKKVAQDNCW